MCDFDLNVMFFFDNCWVQVCFREGLRCCCCDVYCNLFVECFVVVFQCNKNIDFVYVVGGWVVNVGCYDVVFNGCYVVYGYVFIDGCNSVGYGFFDSFVVQICSFQCVNVSYVDCCVSDFSNYSLEVSVFINEVGFRVYFNSNIFVIVYSYGYQVFCCGMVGFFCGFCEVFGVQLVDCGFLIIIGFGQCFFCVYYVCVGYFVQFFYYCGCNCYFGFFQNLQVVYGGGLFCFYERFVMFRFLWKFWLLVFQ